jgi:hypothetical protein
MSRVVLLCLTAGVLALGAFVLSNSEQASATDPPPGLTAGITALDRRPPEQALTPEVEEWIEVITRSPRLGTTAQAAKTRVKRLRSGLGTARRTMWAFRTDAGGVCFLLTGHTGSCLADLSAGTPGLLWTIGGGGENSPGAFVGIASDDVTDVDLTVDGQVVSSTTVVNNVAFAEIAPSSDQALITVKHANGATRTERIEFGGPPPNQPSRISD